METRNVTKMKENTKMSFDPNKPVSLEEYNDALRSSVNAYYEYAMNDPTMSREEAIKTTAEVSEKYMDAVQEFQESQGMQITSDIGTSGGGIGDDNTGDIGVDDSCGVDNDGDGVDGGMDI